jgi:hypothetical protein
LELLRHPDRHHRGDAAGGRRSEFARHVKDASWHGYQHEYGSAGGTVYGIDLDSNFMKLAAGGSLD